MVRKKDKEAALSRWMELPWGPNAPPSIGGDSAADSSGQGSSTPSRGSSLPPGAPAGSSQAIEPFVEGREVVPSIRRKKTPSSKFL